MYINSPLGKKRRLKSYDMSKHLRKKKKERKRNRKCTNTLSQYCPPISPLTTRMQGMNKITILINDNRK